MRPSKRARLALGAAGVGASARDAEQGERQDDSANATTVAGTVLSGLARFAVMEGLVSTYNAEDLLGENDMVESADEKLSSASE